MTRRAEPTLSPCLVHIASDGPLQTIDVSALAQMREMDEDGTLLNEIVQLYVTDSRVYVRAMQSAPIVEAIRLLHTLKSSSGCVGASIVVQSAGALETRARAHGVVPSAHEIHALADLVDAACSELHRLFPDAGRLDCAA